MVYKAIKCVICDSEKIVKNGTQSNGVQRLLCRECGKSFQIEYANNGAKIETKFIIIKMSVNGSGIRDIARVLEISPNTVLDVLKKLKIFLSMSTRNMQNLQAPSKYDLKWTSNGGEFTARVHLVGYGTQSTMIQEMSLHL